MIDRLAQRLESLAMFNGAILIDVGGTIVFERTYGYANYEQRHSLTPRTRFKIASLSKPMTDAALAALLVEGRIRLDDPLSRWLPQFPNSDRITIELITQHRSGIPHTNDQPWGDGPERLELDEILARLAAIAPDFEPGAQRRYSNGGYAALARVLELTCGTRYPEIMRRLVFAPLHMEDSGAIIDSRLAPGGIAKGYQPGDVIGGRSAPRPYLVELRPGGGSLYASPRDVMAFFAAAWRGRLPGAREYPQLFGGAGPTRAADGRSPGYYMDVYFDAAADMIVVSMANNYAAEFRWAENLALIALGQPPLFADLPQLDLARTGDGAWIGAYRREDQTTFDYQIARTEAGRLVFTEASGASRALIPLHDGGYLDPLYYSVCRADAPGRITCRRLYEGGYTMTLVQRT
jgi:CubicO group peptidase (beta-lactamase class C family)